LLKAPLNNCSLSRLLALAFALASAFVWSTAHAIERNWGYTYNSQGLLETADGPRTDVADVTRYAYDVQRLSGSGLVISNQPWGQEEELKELLPWLAERLG